MERLFPVLFISSLILIVVFSFLTNMSFDQINDKLFEINSQLFEIKEVIALDQTSEDQILWGRNEILSFDLNFDSQKAFQISSNAYYYSKLYEVPFPLLMAVFCVESGYNTHAVSKIGNQTGAIGLGQILPSTGRFLAQDLGKEDYDLFDLETNIQFSAYYLASLFEKSKIKSEDSRWHYTLSQYWAGPRSKVKTTYSYKVMKEYKQNISDILAYATL